MEISIDHHYDLAVRDKGGALKILESFPEQAEEAIRIAKAFSKTLKMDRPERVGICGMGGSGVSGRILRSLYPDRDIRVFRDYRLPEYVRDDYLLFIVSYSGNTEETTEMFRQAFERKCRIIAISSNGKMAEFCSRKKIPFVRIPQGMQPRFAFAYMFFPILLSLGRLGFIDVQGIDEAVRHLKETRDEIKSSMKTKDNVSKRLAMRLAGTIPVIHGHGLYRGVAFRAKAQLNENAKTPAFWDEFPEFFHNSLEFWGEKKGLAKCLSSVVLRDFSEGQSMKKRLDFTKGMMKSASSSVELYSAYKSPLSKVLTMMYILDFASVYLGLIYSRDPSRLNTIDAMKKVLNKKEER